MEIEEGAPTERVARATASDAEFATLYARHYRDVHRYVLGVTRSIDEADEVAAETFERAFRAFRNGRLQSGEPLPWLLLTARRITTDRWRRARRFAGLAGSVARPPVDDSDRRRTEFWLWFDAIARVLSGRQREVLILRYQRDLSDADIASIMGLSASGVRSLVARALNVLRSHEELLQ